MTRSAKFALELRHRIQALRVANELSPEELGRRVGLSRSSIVNIEAGRQGVSAFLVHKLAATFVISTDQLLGTTSVSHAAVAEPSVDDWVERILTLAGSRQ